MPPINPPDRPGPTNGPPVHEPPGYLDGLLAIRAASRNEIDATKAQLAKLQQRYDRLEALALDIAFAAGLRLCYDPLVGRAVKINVTGSGISERPTTLTDEDCGLSTRVMLNDDQRAKLAEILGEKPTQWPVPNSFGEAIVQQWARERAADGPMPPKVAEPANGGHDGEAIPEDNQCFADALRERSRVHVSPAFGGPSHGE